LVLPFIWQVPASNLQLPKGHVVHEIALAAVLLLLLLLVLGVVCCLLPVKAMVAFGGF